MPFVICYRSIDGLDVPFIGVNNYYGAFMAARHLIDQGCRKLSYFSQRKYSTAIERYYGYETALRSSQEKVEKKEIILGNYGEEELRERIKFILTEKIIRMVYFALMIQQLLCSMRSYRRGDCSQV